MRPNPDPRAAEAGVDPDTLDAALAAIRSGEALFLVVSGKQASGKDTVAPIVLTELGYRNSEHLSYATPLKSQCDEIIATLRYRFSPSRVPLVTERVRRVAADVISERFAIPTEQALILIRDLLDAVRADESLNARSRTPLMRFVLQYLGTDIRRAQDDNYWVKRALRPALDSLAHGRSVHFTDARFPNEVTVAQSLAAVAVRLDVSPEVQRARLLSRDGISEPDPTSLVHKSETSLDDFDDFDVRVLNEGPLETVIETIVAQLSHASQARPSLSA